MTASPESPELQTAKPNGLQAAEADYLSRLAVELRRALDYHHAGTLTELLRAGRGATPDVIVDLLRGSGSYDTLPTAVLQPDQEAEKPELHPLLFEWYFNDFTARFIAEVALGAGRDILCLGTPSVAAQLSRASVRPDVTLVDADESVNVRFPSLATARVHVGELGTFPTSKSYNVVIADPPWYFSDTMRWLAIASNAVREGGTILIPLFPELTRPSAETERNAILDAAGRLGTVELWTSDVIYRTPGFERHALTALGIGKTGDWRSGDLMVVRRVTGTADWKLDGRIHRGLEGWRRFSIGEQVLMLRDFETTSQTPATFLPIAGCPQNVLTSVSERDPRRSLVGLWTSRNRVAAVGNVRQAARLLDFAVGNSNEVPRGAGSAWTFLQSLLLAR